ncbi:MAG TPA: hypothetical protein VN253_15280 [Kofleriaceae bacterium]|nr:hypothetical protein [Kofleriaceae bacterium]
MAEERTESQGFFEMLWDCDHCDTKGLLAKSQRHCPECGAKQNPDTRYFPKEGEERRIDGHKYEGADRSCGSCNAPQSARANNCTNCGAPLDGAREVKGVGSAPIAPPKKPRRWWLVVLIVALIGLAIFGIWYRFIRKRSETMTVTAHRWERVVPIEEYNDYSEQGWRDTMPSDAHLVSCHPKQRTTRSVPDGEECHNEKQDKKDGTFEVVKKCKPTYRSEPVDDDWCSYRVQRWKDLAQGALRASGTGLQPATPTGLPPANAPPVIGSRRAGHQRETLTLQLGDHSCDVSDATWRKYKDGDKVQVDVRASSGAIVCDSL